MIAPPYIDGALVLEWAWSDVPFGEVRTSDGVAATPIHGLALCRYDDSPEVYRFSCDKRWECQQDDVYESIDSAKSGLPAQYRRMPAVWHKGG